MRWFRSTRLLDLRNTSLSMASSSESTPTEDLDGARIRAEHESGVFFYHQREEHAAGPEVVDVVLARIVLQRKVAFECLLLLDVQVFFVLIILLVGLSVQRNFKGRGNEPEEDLKIAIHDKPRLNEVVRGDVRNSIWINIGNLEKASPE